MVGEHGRRAQLLRQLRDGFVRPPAAHDQSGLGVAGLVAYYWFYVRLLVALFRRFMKGSSQTIIFITLIVLQFIVEYGSVSYYNRSVQVILALGFAATAVNPSLAGSRNNNEGGERAASGYNGQRLAGQV